MERSTMRLAALLAAPLLVAAVSAQAAARRALIVGIDDYTSHRPPGASALAGRGFSDLGGAVRDARAMADMLVSRFGFARRDVVLLEDAAATREAILAAIRRQLVAPAGEGDEVVFYYAGHGSQVRNSKSDEPDRLDESLVPADGPAGVPDVRDKELRRLFNQILDRRARLTLIFDSCHSGSLDRGLPQRARARKLGIDQRDVADATDYGPRPADRGALVLSAAQDHQAAWEIQDADGEAHGAFSYALLSALRSAGVDEAAERIFLRTRLLIDAETAWQEPVLAAGEARRREPPFGGRHDHRAGETVVGVESVGDDGTLVLAGGWVNGLGVGSELRLLPRGPGAAEPDAAEAPAARARVIALDGLTASRARLLSAAEGAEVVEVRAGDLFELDSWLVPAEVTLRLFVPRAERSARELLRQAERIRRGVLAAGAAWAEDPVRDAPSHVIEHAGGVWRLDGPGQPVDLGAAPSPAAVEAALGGVDPAAKVFVHLPAPSAVVDALGLGPGTPYDTVVLTDTPARAHYRLVGRLAGGALRYAWVRPNALEADGATTALPRRSDWLALEDGTVWRLQRSALQIAKVRAWLTLRSPGAGAFPYRLALRPAGAPPARRTAGTVGAGERYGLTLYHPDDVFPSRFQRRYIYVFVIDSDGKSTLLYPLPGQGNVENYLPLVGVAPRAQPLELTLGPEELFRIQPPFGVDTYFLLTSAEPIPNPWILEHDGVRHRGPRGRTALEDLLANHGSATRGAARLTPMTWSLDRLTIESVAGDGEGGSP